jgi:hypothetical protein
VLSGSAAANDFNIKNGDGNAVLLMRQKEDSRESRIVSERLASTQLVELNNISFSENEVGEVIIGGEVHAENVGFGNNSSEISEVTVDNGSFSNPDRILVDDISYSV